MKTSKVLFITGGSSGIGLATARQAVANGHKVFIVGRDKAKLASVVQELGGDNVASRDADIADYSQLTEAVKEAVTRFGKIDVLFANAGLAKGPTGFKQKAEPDQWREMVLTNVLGTALTVQAGLVEIIKTKGHIVITGSALGRTSIPGSLYSATKWATIGMAGSIRKEVTPDGVRVTVIEPGRLNNWEGSKGTDFPMLTPDDVARTVLFAIDQPASVSVDEMLILPTGENI